MFITEVDGETAEDSSQQWWCITKGGSTVNTSADQTPIEDNDAFELTLKEVYSSSVKCQELAQEKSENEARLEELYERWAELEI